MKKYLKGILFVLPTLGLLAVACEKESSEPVYRAPYEKELRFNDSDIESVRANFVQKFAHDTACKHIYLTVADDNNFTTQSSKGITNLHKILDESIQLAPEKISGRGDFHFSKGKASIADSLWFVEHGWTIRQMPNHR
ncbi:hypothetical protein HDR68_01915 [bacterium]|nr:hypothetical protein [bacterium]